MVGSCAPSGWWPSGHWPSPPSVAQKAKPVTPGPMDRARICFPLWFWFSLWKPRGTLCTQFAEMASGYMPAGDIAGYWQVCKAPAGPAQAQPSVVGGLPLLLALHASGPPFLLEFLLFLLQGLSLLPFLLYFPALPPPLPAHPPAPRFTEDSTCFSNHSSEYVILLSYFFYFQNLFLVLNYSSFIASYSYFRTVRFSISKSKSFCSIFFLS